MSVYRDLVNLQDTVARLKKENESLQTVIENLNHVACIVHNPKVLDADGWGITATMLSWLDKMERLCYNELQSRAIKAFRNDVYRLRGHIANILASAKDIEAKYKYCESENAALRSELARVKEAAELLGHAHRAHLHLRSLEDGLCNKVLPVPPLDPKHPLRDMLTNYGMAQLDCAAAEEAVDSNPTAAALVEQARKEKPC